ncbi:MAG TPA: mechanosensitive ion channel family protein [Candidatus Eisenbacteria bacterium]|nr:mechanosensitive ion channel family protein [Candidatus Eisenbacteria bacterium]
MTPPAPSTRTPFALSPVLPETGKLADMGIRIALTIGFAVLLQQVLKVLIRRGERWIVRAGHGGPEAEQRARTFGQIVRNAAAALVWAFAVVHSLGILGWNVAPLLAGAGILGVALGFGAQYLVRDLIAGFFILIENQFAVGDTIEVSGVAATVEALTLRFTQLRDFNGYVHYVPNGEMKIVTNRSRGWNRVAVDVLIAADQDLDPALAVCREVADSMNQDPEWRRRLLEPVELWGVESLVGQEVQVRLVLRARPGGDAQSAARELRRRLHSRLAEAEVRTRSSAIAIATLPPTAGPASSVPVPSRAPAARAPSEPPASVGGGSPGE